MPGVASKVQEAGGILYADYITVAQKLKLTPTFRDVSSLTEMRLP